VSFADHDEVVFLEQSEDPVPALLVLLGAASAEALGVPNGSFEVAFESHIHEFVAPRFTLIGVLPLPLAVGSGPARRGQMCRTALGGGLIQLPAFAPGLVTPVHVGGIAGLVAAPRIVGGCGARSGRRRRRPHLTYLRRQRGVPDCLLIDGVLRKKLHMSNFVRRRIRLSAAIPALSSVV